MSPAEPTHSSAGASGAETHPLDWLERTGTSDALLRELDARRRRRTRRRRGIAALGGAAALLVLAGTWRTMMPPAAGTLPVPSHATIVSVPERRVLADGTIVELKEGAAIDVSFSDRARRVALKQGEAHFVVKKNDAIPFVVSAAGVEVRAVGTAFAVVAAPAAIEVLVTEGRVAVANVPDEGRGTAEQKPHIADAVSAQVGARPVVANAGSRVVVEPLAVAAGRVGATQVTELSATEMDERLGWRVPRIEFSGTPLGEAIPLFNRHSRVRVSLGDPALARLRLSGILRADNVDALARLLEANFGVTAERGANEVVLRNALAAR